MLDFPVVFHFKVEIGKSPEEQDCRFQEVTGLSGEVTTEELREGGVNTYPHRLPTGAKHGNLVLKRGLMPNSKLADWCRKAVEEFTFEPQDVQVTLLNEEHDPVASWTFTGAYPVKWAVSDLKAQENALAVETLELAYRGGGRGKP